MTNLLAVRFSENTKNNTPQPGALPNKRRENSMNAARGQ